MSNPKEILNVTWGGTCKSSDLGIIEGKAIVFGSETDHDVSSFKDFFSDTTYIHPDDEFTTPLFLEHGFSYRGPIGKARIFKTEGSWDAIAELNMDLPAIKERFSDIKSGKYGFSSGSAGHVVDRAQKSNGTHHITQWPFSELSITLTPAEPKALIRSVKSLDAYYNDLEPDPMTNLTIMDDMEEMENESSMGDSQDHIDYFVEMNTQLMELIKVLIEQRVSKSVDNILVPQLEELKSLLEKVNVTPTQVEGDLDEKLTVLKSVEDLTKKLTELQSSFDEKEVLLSEKVALLSETQAELETKSQELTQLEEALTKSKEGNEELTVALDKQKKLTIALSNTHLNK